MGLSEIQSQLKAKKEKKDDGEVNAGFQPANISKKPPAKGKNEMMSMSIKQRRELLTRYDVSESEEDGSDWSS